MTTKLATLLIATTLLGSPPSQAEGLVDRLLGFLGISATPSQMKGPGDGIESGEIWIVDLGAAKPRQVSGDTGYRWPVFVPNAKTILALRDESILSISLPAGSPKLLHTIKGIQKLVGFAKDDEDKVLVLMESEESASAIGVLSLASGRITPVPHDAKQDRRLLTHLGGQERVYGNTKLYLKAENKTSVTGAQLEWFDIYLKQGDAEPRPVSRCDGISCGQPSLSSDGQQIVFIKGRP